MNQCLNCTCTCCEPQHLGRGCSNLRRFCPVGRRFWVRTYPCTSGLHTSVCRAPGSRDLEPPGSDRSIKNVSLQLRNKSNFNSQIILVLTNNNTNKSVNTLPMSYKCNNFIWLAHLVTFISNWHWLICRPVWKSPKPGLWGSIKWLFFSDNFNIWIN